MDERSQMLEEAYNRGLLPPDMKSAFEEAKSRGIISTAVAPKSFQEKLMETWPVKMGQGILEAFKAPGQAYQSTWQNPITTEEMIKPATEMAGLIAGDTKFAKNIPSKDQIFEAGSKAFDAAREMGTKYHPDLIPAFARSAKTHLDEAGFTPDTAEKVHSLLDRYSSSTFSQEPTTVNDILGFRKKLRIAQGITDPQEKTAATIAKNSFDTIIDNAAPFTVEGDAATTARLLQEGRQNWAAAERLETIDQKQAAAELRASAANSGMNTANKIRQNLASVLLSPKQSAGWSPEALQQAQTVVGGTPIGNLARYVGNYFGKGGGLGGLAATGAGALVGGAPGAMAAAGIGMGAHLIDAASTARQMALLRALLSKESPLAQTMPASTVPSDLVSKLTTLLLTNNQIMPTMSNTLSNGSQTQ